MKFELDLANATKIQWQRTIDALKRAKPYEAADGVLLFDLKGILEAMKPQFYGPDENTPEPQIMYDNTRIAGENVISEQQARIAELEAQLERKDKVVQVLANRIQTYTGSCPHDSEQPFERDGDCEKHCEVGIAVEECWIKWAEQC